MIRSDQEIREYVTGTLRKITPALDRQPCYICSAHGSIAELHHVRSIKLLADEVILYGVIPKKVYMTIVWLCPTHHRLIHILYDIGHSMLGKTFQECMYVFARKHSIYARSELIRFEMLLRMSQMTLEDSVDFESDWNITGVWVEWPQL